MAAHESALGEMRGYYGQVTHANLDLIKALKVSGPRLCNRGGAAGMRLGGRPGQVGGWRAACPPACLPDARRTVSVRRRSKLPLLLALLLPLPVCHSCVAAG